MNEALLRAYLADGDWHTWRDITAATGVTRDDVRNTKLFITGLLGNSRLGVKLVEHATAQERVHAVNSLRSRAAEILTRAAELETA